MPSPITAKRFRRFTAKSGGLKYDDEERGWASPSIAAHVLVTWKLSLEDFYALGS